MTDILLMSYQIRLQHLLRLESSDFSYSNYCIRIYIKKDYTRCLPKTTYSHKKCQRLFRIYFKRCWYFEILNNPSIFANFWQILFSIVLHNTATFWWQGKVQDLIFNIHVNIVNIHSSTDKCKIYSPGIYFFKSQQSVLKCNMF